MRKKENTDHAFRRYILQSAKERLLQLLFPRVCPVCGDILKLPSGWTGHLLIQNPYHNISPALLRRLRSILICKDCYPLQNYLSPPFCRKCAKPLEFEDDLFCDICKKRVRRFDRGASLWIHDDIAKKILYDLKFRNKKDNAELIGFEMALRLNPFLESWKPEIILPVPLHKKRMTERGFNQALLIAERFSFWLEKIYGVRLPVDPSYLIRKENTKPQRTLDSSMRFQNVSHAFTVNPERRQAPYRSVLLIDDIFTSGSTIDACAKALKKSGTGQVFFLTASVVS